MATYRIEEGDLLFARTGATTGKTHLVSEPPPVESVFASYLIRVRPKPTTSAAYLNAFFQSDVYWQQLVDHKSGSAQANVNATKLATLQVPVVGEETQKAIARFMKAVQERSLNPTFPLPPLPPPLSEQQKIVEWIDAVATRVEEANTDVEAATKKLDNLLMSALLEITEGASESQLEEIAPLTRRPAEIDPSAEYPGISARSFGRGTFHNPPLLGSEITWQKPYEVKAGDILVSNIKAWEGAIAVVSPEDDGRFGSHRYLTFEPKEGVATPRYVCFYLLSPAGLFHVGEASPGSADRNRTTGSRAMQKIPVPVPPYKQQLWFDQLYEKVEEAKVLIAENQTERSALLPSVLNQIFNGGDH
ncbi:restriction endonuclease subunit S [Rubinisphaera sp. JC750]|uniref:restriction endonuclease subunit S n=1 Tax=Rubinisphaera sp. JC750 TaxID=2898658 RepID=UPI001F02ECE1|nr:restriction endonuclease subunit S [Rubinisphaera sp. JC750]